MSPLPQSAGSPPDALFTPKLDDASTSPLATDFFTTSMRVSNAKVARLLGWKPVVAPTYRQGIQQALLVLEQQDSVSSAGARR
jgi:hypothetical protein